MDDVFKDTMKQVFREAEPDLVEGFKKELIFIQEQFKHRKTTAQSCLDGMSVKPSLLELLAAAYVVNGGLALKHEEIETEPETTGTGLDDLEYKKLMEEMEELNFKPAEAEAEAATLTKP
jgi:hypothetical protein